MPQDIKSKSKGSLLNTMEVETDSDNPEFSLPPKSIVKRHKKSMKKVRIRSNWRKFCRKCWRYCSGVLLVLVLSACVLSISVLSWFSLRLYRDVESLSRRLTIELGRVEAEQVANAEKCSSLRQKMENNMNILKSGQNEILSFRRQLVITNSKISKLNETFNSLSHTMLYNPNSRNSLSHTVNALQKGMADTGAEMTKITDEIKQLKEFVSMQSRTIRRKVFGRLNASLDLCNITGKSVKMFKYLRDYVSICFPNTNDDSEEHRSNKLLLGNHTLSHMSRQIPLLWKELHFMNRSIAHIQRIILSYKQGERSLRHRVDSDSYNTDDGFDLDPGDSTYDTSMQNNKKRDSLRTLFHNIKSNRKYSHNFHDFMHDNNDDDDDGDIT